MEEKEYILNSMTVVEYQKALKNIVDGVENKKTLQRLYVLAKERTEKVTESSPDYRAWIVEMVYKTQKTEYLEFIYNLLQSFKEKWGI